MVFSSGNTAIQRKRARIAPRPDGAEDLIRYTRRLLHPTLIAVVSPDQSPARTRTESSCRDCGIKGSTHERHNSGTDPVQC